MGTIVHAPAEAHVCRPGWRIEYFEASDEPFPFPAGHYLVQDRPWPSEGTVVQCECGRTWVCWYQAPLYDGYVDLGPRWRPEGRFERWRRERTQRRLQ